MYIHLSLIIFQRQAREIFLSVIWVMKMCALLEICVTSKTSFLVCVDNYAQYTQSTQQTQKEILMQPKEGDSTFKFNNFITYTFRT